jgi:hypothetical protein
VGAAFIVAAAVRFVRTRSLLKDEKVYKTGFALEFALAIILAALIVIASIPLLVTAL